MRRIVMFSRVTPDGYLGAPGGNLDWMEPDDELDRAAMSSTSGYDTFVLGRKTYEMFAAYWPHALDDSKTAADPHDTRRRSAETRAMAVALNASLSKKRQPATEPATEQSPDRTGRPAPKKRVR